MCPQPERGIIVRPNTHVDLDQIPGPVATATAAAIVGAATAATTTASVTVSARRGFFGIGMFEPKEMKNLGGLLRSAQNFSAAFVFTIGARYHPKAPTDTLNTTKHLPLFHYQDFDDFCTHMPFGADLVAIELSEQAKPLETYSHPSRAVYLLGGEDRTLPAEVLGACKTVRQIATRYCLNVASAATVVMYDRNVKQSTKGER